jgi:hypothetical protein
MRAMMYLPGSVQEGAAAQINTNLTRAMDQINYVMNHIAQDLDESGVDTFGSMWEQDALMQLQTNEEEWIASKEVTKEIMASVEPPFTLFLDAVRYKTILTGFLSISDIPYHLQSVVQMVQKAAAQIGNRFVSATVCVVHLNRGTGFAAVKPFLEAMATKMNTLFKETMETNNNMLEVFGKAEEIASSSSGLSNKRRKMELKKLDRAMNGKLKKETRHRYIGMLLQDAAYVETALKGYIGVYQPTDAGTMEALSKQVVLEYENLDDANRL